MQLKNKDEKMSKIKIEQVESLLEDLAPDEESAEAFGVSYITLDQNRRLKISCTKTQDSDEAIFVGAAKRFNRMFYFYQY